MVDPVKSNGTLRQSKNPPDRVLLEAIYFPNVQSNEIHPSKGEAGKNSYPELCGEGLERQHPLQPSLDADKHGSHPVWANQQPFHPKELLRWSSSTHRVNEIHDSGHRCEGGC